MRELSVSVIGLGYVGLTTAVALASKGFRVRGYEIDQEKVDRINKGNPTFHEPGLQSLLKKALANGFKASGTLGIADIHFVTVGTPSLDDGSIDLSYIRQASESIGQRLKEQDKYSLVAVKSSVTPGTTENIVKPLVESASGRVAGRDFGLASNPEFLKEGSAVKDTLKPDRIVVGEFDKRSGDLILRLYRRFYGAGLPPVIRTTPVNAELIKYANNAFLATKVSFINMIAGLCQLLPRADVQDVAQGIGLDKRIGSDFLRAGAGWGGSCWPKDLRALRFAARSLGIEFPIIDATIQVNEAQANEVLALAQTLTGGLSGKRVAVLGLSFKPNTDDMREAVSIKVVGGLLENHAEVRTYDPAAMENARRVFSTLPKEMRNRLSFTHSALDAIKDADCCIVVTEWGEFGRLKPSDFTTAMRHAAVVDGRRIYDPMVYSKRLRFAAVGLGVVSRKGYDE